MMPFPHHPIVIPVICQYGKEGGVPDPLLVHGIILSHECFVCACILAGVECGTADPADGGGDAIVVEQDAVLCHFVNDGGLDEGCYGPECFEAPIVRVEQENVERFVCLMFLFCIIIIIILVVGIIGIIIVVCYRWCVYRYVHRFLTILTMTILRRDVQ